LKASDDRCACGELTHSAKNGTSGVATDPGAATVAGVSGAAGACAFDGPPTQNTMPLARPPATSAIVSAVGNSLLFLIGSSRPWRTISS
jgi:hypothetical protein